MFVAVDHTAGGAVRVGRAGELESAEGAAHGRGAQPHRAGDAAGRFPAVQEALVDGRDSQCGLLADCEFAEAGSNSPVALEALDAALAPCHGWCIGGFVAEVMKG
ncbi:hypothetical protein JCM4914_15620 [Streptomyces platensis subsp. malvinus]